MATTSPARIDDDLYASAKLAGEAQSRSASQQVAHWARIGREIEASTSISIRAVAEVLAGRRPYDGLDAEEQAVVRAEWAERMRAYREGLDLPRQFEGEGRSTWVELDDDGNVVERHRSTVRQDPAAGMETPAPRKDRAAGGAARSKTTGKSDAGGAASTGRSRNRST